MTSRNDDINQAALTLGGLAAQGWTGPEKTLEYGWLWKFLNRSHEANHDLDQVSPGTTNDHWYFNLPVSNPPVEQPPQGRLAQMRTKLRFLVRLYASLRSRIFGGRR